jgi:hypothetical protein
VAHVISCRPFRPWHGLARHWVAALLLLLPQLALAASADEAIAERRVKAAYLYRFAGYVQWPAGTWSGADSPMVIGIWGNDELADDLTRLVAGRTVDGRRIEVHRFGEPDLAGKVHMLYVGKERTARLPEALASPQLRSALIVTESAKALELGSAINFVIVDGQVRFELSPDAAEQRGLKLSSRLVAVSSNLSTRGR